MPISLGGPHVFLQFASGNSAAGSGAVRQAAPMSPGPMTTIRPMGDDDVAGAAETWIDAFGTMRAAYHLPVEERTDAAVARLQARLRHLLRNDPGGSWVAEDGDGRVVGLAQALVREGLWVLSLFGVVPGHQEAGVGRRLLDAAVAYGSGVPAGLILCSRDPRAMRRYARAGFDLHPSVTAYGTVDRDRDRLRPDDAVREGGPEDMAFVAALERRL